MEKNELIETLKVYSVPGDDEAGEAPAAVVEQVVEPVESTSTADADDEFDALLDAMDEDSKSEQSSKPSSGGDDITDDEFESLLDNLHGKGKHSGGKPLKQAMMI